MPINCGFQSVTGVFRYLTIMERFYYWLSFLFTYQHNNIIDNYWLLLLIITTWYQPRTFVCHLILNSASQSCKAWCSKLLTSHPKWMEAKLVTRWIGGASVWSTVSSQILMNEPFACTQLFTRVCLHHSLFALIYYWGRILQRLCWRVCMF